MITTHKTPEWRQKQHNSFDSAQIERTMNFKISKQQKQKEQRKINEEFAFMKELLYQTSRKASPESKFIQIPYHKLASKPAIMAKCIEGNCCKIEAVPATQSYNRKLGIWQTI
mgnify:CR=1 FL=1